MGVLEGILVGVVILFIVALGTLGAYTSLAGVKSKKGKLSTIDVAFLRKYNVKKEMEVSEKDFPLVQRYASTGLMQTGLSKNSIMTAKLSERGRRLIE